MSQGRAALQKDELWQLLVETVHAFPMYKHHKRYVQDVMLKDKPEISAKELAVQINVPLGEAIVLLDEVRSTSSPQAATGSASISGKAAGQTLLDFNG
jgi:hypothetical protein